MIEWGDSLGVVEEDAVHAIAVWIIKSGVASPAALPVHLKYAVFDGRGSGRACAELLYQLLAPGLEGNRRTVPGSLWWTLLHQAIKVLHSVEGDVQVVDFLHHYYACLLIDGPEDLAVEFESRFRNELRARQVKMASRSLKEKFPGKWGKWHEVMRRVIAKTSLISPIQ